MPHREVIQRICEDNNCESGTGYCLLKEILTSCGHLEDATAPIESNCHEGGNCVLMNKIMELGVTDRTVVQMKCIEILKYEESIVKGRNIGWNEAIAIWTKKHSERFSEKYNANADPRELYRRVVAA